jgi:hypothetical protein
MYIYKIDAFSPKHPAIQVQSRSHLSVDIVVAVILALLLWHLVPEKPKDEEATGW